MSEPKTIRDLLTAAHQAGMVLRRERRNRADSSYHSYKLVGPHCERVTASRHMAGGPWWVTFNATTADVHYIELSGPSIAKLLLAAELCELTRHLSPDYRHEPEGV